MTTLLDNSQMICMKLALMRPLKFASSGLIIHIRILHFSRYSSLPVSSHSSQIAIIFVKKKFIEPCHVEYKFAL